MPFSHCALPVRGRVCLVCLFVLFFLLVSLERSDWYGSDIGHDFSTKKALVYLAGFQSSFFHLGQHRAY